MKAINIVWDIDAPTYEENRRILLSLPKEIEEVFMNTKCEIKKKITNLVIKNIIIPITRNEKPRKNIYKEVWK